MKMGTEFWVEHVAAAKLETISASEYLPFFMDIEKQWGIIPEYAVLLKHFGTPRLRRALLPMRWMREIGLVVPDAAAKEDDSDQRRIDASLDKVGMGTKERAILDGYRDGLMADLKDENTTLRSIRLALTPAAALLVSGREMKRVPPDQKVLDAYLEKTPGQRAAVSGFVCYLRDRHGVEISLPKANSGKSLLNRKRKLEAEMLALMQVSGEGEKFRQQWLSVALAYFHGLPRNVGRSATTLDSPDIQEGFTVQWRGASYWIPVSR